MNKEQPELFTVVSQGRNQWDRPSDKYPLPPTARPTDPETSKEAGRQAHGKLRQQVLAVLREAGEDGLTDFEVSQKLDILRGTASKRRSELGHQGFVQATNRRRKTDTGSSAIVWQAV